MTQGRRTNPDCIFALCNFQTIPTQIESHTQMYNCKRYEYRLSGDKHQRYTNKYIMFLKMQQDECSRWFRRPYDKLAFLRIKMMLPLAEIAGLKSLRFQSYFSFYYFNEINVKTLSLIQARSPGHNELKLFLLYHSKFLEFFLNFSHSYYTNQLMSREMQFEILIRQV